MTTRNQVRGALLEEIILWLLEFAGYRTVTGVGADPTLRSGHSGIEVRGRGTAHQIDAIADFTIGQPFTNPQRLLVEAKAYEGVRPIGIGSVRNAVGVLKDVGEFWTGASSRRRYHYQYAMFSLTPFTKGAQRYAFAQDVYLVPLSASQFFLPIAEGLRETVGGLPADRAGRVTVAMSELRMTLRQALRTRPDELAEARTFVPLMNSVRQFGRGLFGIAGQAFPLLLVPRGPDVIDGLDTVIQVRIRGQEGTWYLQASDGGPFLFSFDLPEELFKLYADQGVLSPQRAVDLKAEYLHEIQALYVTQGQTRLVTFRLDNEWLRQVREELHVG